MHAGHIRFLENCAQLGSLTVGVNTDRFVRTYKPSPRYTHPQRAETLAALSCVTRVVFNDGPGKDLIEELRPDVLAVGPDWLTRDYLAQIGTTANQLLNICVLAFVGPPRQEGLASSA